jgi:cytochrome d ubiquinol oxidase subunit II
LQRIFKNRAKAANIAAIASGIAVFLASASDGVNLFSIFTSDVFALACMALATLSVVPLWLCIGKNLVQLARLTVAVEVGLILIGWFKIQYPVLIFFRSTDLPNLTIYNAAAPESVLTTLLYALIFGCALIFPALIYLLAIFKRSHSTMV